MNKIIEFFKKLFGNKVEEPKVYSTSSVRKPSTNSQKPKPTTTGLPKSTEIKADIELSEKPKPKKKRYYKPKPKQGGTSSGNGKQPYNTK